jgi:hypothetical protein
MTDKERLINEWLEHGKIVLAVDYDDTIFSWKNRTVKECKNTMDLVKWAQHIGAYIMIHTCSPKDRHEEIKNYCESHGLKVDSINENPIKLPYGNEGKPYYNWQLCDRSGLEHAESVLLEASNAVITEKRQKYLNTLDEIG